MLAACQDSMNRSEVCICTCWSKREVVNNQVVRLQQFVTLHDITGMGAQDSLCIHAEEVGGIPGLGRRLAMVQLEWPGLVKFCYGQRGLVLVPVCHRSRQIGLAATVRVLALSIVIDGCRFEIYQIGGNMDESAIKQTLQEGESSQAGRRAPLVAFFVAVLTPRDDFYIRHRLGRFGCQHSRLGPLDQHRSFHRACMCGSFLLK